MRQVIGNVRQAIRRAGLGFVLCGISLPLIAQTPRSGGGGESERIIQQYQQLAAEKTSLEAQVASLKHDLDAARAQLADLASVKKERDALRTRSTAITANLAGLEAGKQAAEKSAEQSKARMNELVARFRQTINELQQLETDRDQLKNQLRDRSTAYDKCAQDNLSLFEINTDLLNRYEHVSLFRRLTADEPFTRLTRNRIENLVDEYRERALELRAKSSSGNGGDKSAGKPPASP